MENNQQDVDQQAYMDNAIRAVQQKKPPPEIDFTLHTMEDGSQVSTMERVCKGKRLPQLCHALYLVCSACATETSRTCC
jgi:serine/threonine-protein phosphatase 2B catalytic subunit